MYAVIRSGGKQYKVAKGDVIAVEKMAVDKGQSIVLDDVAMVGAADTVIGTPRVAGACVHALVDAHARTDKVVVFKKKRRKNYRRKSGHRQDMTLLKIVDIKTDAATASKKTRSTTGTAQSAGTSGAKKSPGLKAKEAKSAAPSKKG